MSDIVFLRAWTQVEVPSFYNPLTTALQPRDQTWRGMKTVAELRREHNLPVPVNKDSLYKVKHFIFYTFVNNFIITFKVFLLRFLFPADRHPFACYVVWCRSQLNESGKSSTPW